MSGDEGEKIIVRIEGEAVGLRLDKVLSRMLPDYSRTHLKRLIKRERVKVDGQLARPSHTVAAGEQVEIDLARIKAESRAVLVSLDIPVLHEDDALLVIDKPAGITVHPNSAIQDGTVAQWAEWKYGPLPCAEGDEGRPGIVHRLDRDTSGVMVLARTMAAMEELQNQFRQRLTKKTYMALVYGVPEFDSDWVEKPIARNPRHPGRMRVVEDDGRESSTYWEREESFGSWALLRCKPRTGRTHQIRVHLASAGHSVVNDRLYGSPNAQRCPLPKAAPQCGRHALHALSLAIRHPVNGELVSFSSEIPRDMADLIEWLRCGQEEGSQS